MPLISIKKPSSSIASIAGSLELGVGTTLVNQHGASPIMNR